MRPAVFLDRDGVLVWDAGYLTRHEDLRWFSYAIEAVRLLSRANFLTFVTTNQGGVGLGYYSEEFVRDTHALMAATLEASGARVDGWLFCPHHPRAILDEYRVPCECRKPAPGLVRAAAAIHPVDLSRSFVVGDKATDMELAERVGARGVFVRTGQGESELARAGGTIRSAWTAPDLMAATAWILETSQDRKEAGRRNEQADT